VKLQLCKAEGHHGMSGNLQAFITWCSCLPTAWGRIGLKRSRQRLPWTGSQNLSCNGRGGTTPSVYIQSVLCS
jgi:hypothetical protein